MSKAIKKTSDDFMWEVASELSRNDLARNASFQEHCLNAFGWMSSEQAAESWERRA